MFPTRWTKQTVPSVVKVEVEYDMVENAYLRLERQAVTLSVYTYMHPVRRNLRLIDKHTYTRTHTGSHTRARARARAHTHTHTHTRVRARAHTHAHTHARTHTYTHKCKGTQTQTHTQHTSEFYA